MSFRTSLVVLLAVIVAWPINKAWCASSNEKTVTSERASLYAEPDESSPIRGYLKQGRHFRSTGAKAGFFKLALKGGQTVWIKAGDVETPAIDAEAEVNTDEDSTDFKRWNLQIGVSSGNASGQSYTEVNLGIGYYFFKWLELENSLFTSLNRVENISGLDSSLRGVLDTDLAGIAHIHLFAGAGYRFATKSDFDTVFGEAGLITSVSGFSIGGGVRDFLYSMKGGGRSDESQYFIILSGGAHF
jgi:hypothetical protein